MQKEPNEYDKLKEFLLFFGPLVLFMGGMIFALVQFKPEFVRVGVNMFGFFAVAGSGFWFRGNVSKMNWKR